MTETLSPLQRAGLALQEMRNRIDTLERSQTEPIAIVGMGCRFPGNITDPDSFWQLLRDGKNAVGEIPKTRSELLASDKPNYPQRGGFLDRIDEFDAEFFGISPREAATMDPQQRLLLEVSWEALENGGIAPSKLAGSKAGVFLGISLNEFLQYSLFADRDQLDIYSATGSSLSIAAGRIAYWLGLHGPAIAIDTACSSSLVAIHLACQSLRQGECTLAIAAGSHLMLSPKTTLAMSKLNALSPDGYCKTFDASADGYGRGEGCGAIVLKRLGDACTDGDRILALIRGSAVNHDGRSSGLTVPNGPAQQAVVRSALQNARVNPQDVQYLEAHGTGTPLGDPIEVGAIDAVFGKGRSQPLAIGSVKTNIGHLEAAAGIAGLMKVVLAMQHGEIPAHLHLQNLNDRIDLGDRISIPTQRQPWTEKSRLAGVSSFGFSGTNAHVIIESAPELTSPKTTRSPQILCLSAKSKTALQQRITALSHYLETHPDLELADICVTANAGRSHFAHRVAFLPSTRSQLQAMLAETTSIPENVATQPPQIAFYFPAIASTNLTLGRSLYDSEPHFRSAIDACADCVDGPLVEILQGKIVPDRDIKKWQQLTTVSRQVSLTQLWRSWGIEPTTIVGDGIGKQVAAWASGSLNLSELFSKLTTAIASETETISEVNCDIAIVMGDIEGLESSQTVKFLPSLDPQRTNWEVLLNSLSQLYIRGADIRWEAVERNQKRTAIVLPTYPFQQETYPLQAEPKTDNLLAKGGDRTLLDRRLDSPLAAIQFESQWHLDRLPLVRDHRLQGQPIVNLVVYLEMLQEAAIATCNRPIRQWNSIVVPHALAFDGDIFHRVQLILTPLKDDGCEFKIFSQSLQNPNSPDWQTHITGELQLTSEPLENFNIKIAQVKHDCSEVWQASTFYKKMRSRGIDLGPSCQLLDTIWRRDGEAIGKLALSNLTASGNRKLPMSAIDACFQLFAACLPTKCADTYIILSVEQLQIDAIDDNRSPQWVYAKIQLPNESEVTTLSADLMLLDNKGQCLMKAKQVQLRRWSSSGIKSRSRQEKAANSTIDIPDLSQLSELPANAQQEIAERYLIATLSKLLRFPADKIGSQQFLGEMVDSLIAFELRNQIENDWHIRLSIDNFLGRSTLSQLANRLLEQHAIATLVSSSDTSDNIETLTI